MLYAKPTENTRADVTLRGVYILLRVQDEEGGVKAYSPLLESEDGKKLKALLDARLAEDRKKVGAAVGAKGGKK